MKKPNYRIIKHTTSKNTYYTLQHRGVLWGWNTLKEDIGWYSCDMIPKRFKTTDEVYKYLDSLKPEITEVIEEIY